MRVLAACIVAFGLVASPGMAAAGGAANDALGATGANNVAVTTATVPNAPVAAATKESPAKPAESSMESELQQLRDLLEAQSKQLQSQSQQLQEQQQKMLELEASLHSAAPESAAAPASAGSAAVQGTQAASAAPDWGKRLDGLEKKLGAIGPFSFSGDIRLRDEPFFGGPINQSQARNRERYRVRLYLNAKLNDDISGGLSFATGDPNDPITTNQTVNQFFTRHPFLLDRAFITYTPHQFKPLTLTGGKFVYPWYRTELTWDNDLNPDGLAQKLEWKSDKWTLLKQFALVGFELPFGETSQSTAVSTFNQGGPSAQFPYSNASIRQSVVYGGQVQTRWQLGSRLSVTLDEAFYNWHNPDALALASQQQDAASPALGLLKMAGNGLTNSYQTITESFTVPIVTPSGCTVACTITGTTTVNSFIVGAKLNSKFALSDTIAQFDIKTSSPKWPIRFLADYVQNTRACENDSTLAFIGAPPTGSTITHSNKSPSVTKTGAADPLAVNGCNRHDRRGTWLEGRFGRQAEKGDWQFSYTHMLIEREAVMSLVDFSDMRQASDVQQNRMEVFYNWQKNVQFGFTGLFGRPLHPAVTNPAEGTLKRLQFDVVYKF